MILVSIVLFYVLFVSTNSLPTEQRNPIFQTESHENLRTRQLYFTELSTNLQYNYVNDQGDYRLYKLIPKPTINQAQIKIVNKWLEQYLQQSFERPEGDYSNVLQFCGTTILAFFLRNSTLSIKNINALLLAHLQAYDNSQYVCFLSTLKEHRQKGLGTKLLNVFINDAIRANHSRISLHVNTENTNAFSLYSKCGMRCIQYIPKYYFGDRTFPTQNAFLMSLQLKNIRNSTTICQSTAAINIPNAEETFYKQRCPQAFTG
ncbi:hypothetical protein I4U23_030996 [Adineta vaga]|nr:hypothetical protein I4U23_030996 [Adineta vaga]